MKQLDFNGLNNFLMGRCQALLSSWLPGGRVIGNEYKCGDISGSPGDSFSVNLSTGKWADFATGQRGGDLVSLYGAMRALEPGDAYRALAAEQGFVSGTPFPQLTGQTESDIRPPPMGFPAPKMHHDRYGNPTETYEYRGPNGETLHYIAKYTFADGSKQFVPFSYSTKTNNWVKKAWPKPRPLFNLDKLSTDTHKPVMIVEGEKCVLAAEKIASKSYTVTTWPGGAQAWKQADWDIIKGRDVLLWPDADQPGLGAMSQIAGMLVQHNKSVKLLDVSGMPDKWDAGDATFQSITELVAWAKPRAKLIEPPPLRPEVLPAEHIQRSLTVEKPKNNLHCALEGYGSFSQLYTELGIQTTGENQNPVSNVANAMILLTHYSEFKGRFWYDRFHNAFFTTWGVDEPTKWTDQMTTRLQARLQIGFGLKTLSPSMAESAMAAVAADTVRSEPNEWIETLPRWDGQPRINESFFVHFGVTPSAYQEAVSKNFWISIVARIVRPGCKCDTMVILEGKQGAFKSTALSIIGGKFYTQNNEQVTNKDFKLVLRGSFLIEIAELESFSKADGTKIKSILSDAHDNFRIPYGKLAEKFPRQSVFAGTTNADEYLSDETGARRFWPVRTGETHGINLSQLIMDRDQMFAEALHRFNQGETWWEVPQDEAKEMQAARYMEDPWKPAILSYVESYEVKNKAYIRTDEFLEKAIKMDLSNVARREEIRLGKILRPLGWVSKPVWTSGHVIRAWVRPLTLENPNTSENR